jgi:hypothetical protein
MNKALSLVLLSALGDLPYIDKKTGVVQVVLRPITENGETAYRKIPVSTLATSQECEAPEHSGVDMIPDSQYKGMLYFEDRGSGVGARRASAQQYQSDLRLVCWLNTERISGEPDMTLSGKAINQIIGILTKRIPVVSPFLNINVVVTRIPEQSANIFSPYDYPEGRTQYLFSPYDFFAIDLRVSFDLAKNCSPDIIPVTPTLC